MRSLPKETDFWRAFGVWFSYEPVLSKLLRHSDSEEWEIFGSSDFSFLFVGHRKTSTLSWTIPENDADLIDNHIEQAELSHLKGADYFESLLMLKISTDA